MERNDGQRRIRQCKPVQRSDERRQRIKNKYRNRQYDVTVIEATQTVVLPDKEPPKKKVCAYCRVSTDEDAQLSSYELQVQYYQEYINAHTDWELVDIYADEVIIANQHGKEAPNREKRFEYRTGAIEDTRPVLDDHGECLEGVLNQKGIQEQICDILEGGRDAFELRRKKYMRN